MKFLKLKFEWSFGGTNRLTLNFQENDVNSDLKDAIRISF